MSSTNNVTNPAVSYSGEVDSLLIEKFTGKVKEQYIKQENLLRFFDVQEVTGTNMVSEKFMGDTQIQVLSPGQDPEATGTDQDKNALVIDTTVISRNAVAMFHDIQNDIDGYQSKLSMNQAKQLSRLEDEMVVQQLIYSAQSNTLEKRTNPRVPGHGFSYQISISETQASDPENLQASIELAVENMLTGADGGDGVDLTDLYVMMPWPEFNVLRDAERIVNANYRDFAGETVNGFTLKSYNLPIIPSNRFPRNVGGNVQSRTSILSNATNGQRYTASLDQASARAVIFKPEALLAGKTIDMQGDIFWDKRSKSWFVDTFMAEGCIPSAWDGVAVVDTVGDTEDTDVTARASRKVVKTQSVA